MGHSLHFGKETQNLEKINAAFIYLYMKEAIMITHSLSPEKFLGMLYQRCVVQMRTNTLKTLWLLHHLEQM